LRIAHPVVALVFAAALAAVFPGVVRAQSSHAQAAPGRHTVTVRFNYDFKPVHACSAKPRKRCVAKFNVYNVTVHGQRYLLFSIPAPAKARKEVLGITGTSKPLPLAPGQHMIAVTAVWNNGVESRLHASTTMVIVKN
jgi:hypothetical protein